MRKLLVTNRGEIATRAFRAAYELGLRSVAIYTPEDRESVHRVKADEAYEIGEPGHPVRAYLDPELIAETAKSVAADAVYPGYGFLSENPDLATACAERDITFVGPPASVLERVGDKVRARTAAREAGLPVLEAGETPSDTMRLRDMSTIEAGVLDEAIREILAIQRRMANKAKYVPDLQGSPLA